MVWRVPYWSQSLYKRCLSSIATPAAIPQALPSIRKLLEVHHQQALQSSQSSSHHQDESITLVVGFARAIRTHRNLTFVNLTDGSLPGDSTLQAVLKGHAKAQWDSQLSLGVGLELRGRFQASKGANQPVEFAVEDLKVTGKNETSTYPLASATNLSSNASSVLHRKYAHLRPRDIRHASVLRMRNALEKGLSDYFWENDFTRVAAPIITSSDCEGGGEVFKVDAVHEGEGEVDVDLEVNLAQEPSLSGSTAEQPPSIEANEDLRTEPSMSDSSGDFSGTPTTPNKTSFWSDSTAYLTVSSQLHLEAIALGLGRVYTVGPSFRAESSATNRHLAEFWMCEGEMMTCSDGDEALEQVMSVVESLLKHVISFSLSNGEARYLWATDESGLERLNSLSTSQPRWPRMTYKDAIQSIQQSTEDFTITPPKWGDSLASEHERWLARNGPIFITHYPSSIKPFYMRVDDNAETVACFDLLVPRIGELVGGSLREERQEILASRLSTLPSNPHLQWYANDLRKYGCNPHGGFGLGMERLLSWISNTDNLRDCLTFPRVKGRLRF